MITQSSEARPSSSYEGGNVALLDQLWRHCGTPDNVWSQQWQVDDLIIWDNRCTMHRRDPFVGAGLRRMHRLTTLGERPT